MIVGCVKETFPGERRVALVPKVVPQLTKLGCEIVLQRGAGTAAGFPDPVFTERGVKIVEGRDEVLRSADLLLQVRGYGANPDHGRADVEQLRRGQVLIGMFEPLTAVDAVRAVAEKGVTLFAMELIPRITRAQSMDVLSSMATVAGYRAVLLAASHLPKMFPMMMTAAGTLAPAKVFVIGAGVAGLQAIATSRRLGAQVEAYDLRPAVREQVESLGAKFVEMELETADAEDAGGYAKQMGEEFYRRQRELMAGVTAESDVVISTAAVPGKKAPVLITASMLERMREGSVIVDLAAERGGNCETTRPGETVVQSGVTILGPINLSADVPYHASEMYAKNVTTLVQLMVKEGKLELNLEDEVIRETMVTHDGRVSNPRVAEALGMAGNAN